MLQLEYLDNGKVKIKYDDKEKEVLAVKLCSFVARTIRRNRDTIKIGFGSEIIEIDRDTFFRELSKIIPKLCGETTLDIIENIIRNLTETIRVNGHDYYIINIELTNEELSIVSDLVKIDGNIMYVESYDDLIRLIVRLILNSERFRVAWVGNCFVPFMYLTNETILNIIRKYDYYTKYILSNQDEILSQIDLENLEMETIDDVFGATLEVAKYKDYYIFRMVMYDLDDYGELYLVTSKPINTVKEYMELYELIDLKKIHDALIDYLNVDEDTLIQIYNEFYKKKYY